MYSLIAKGISTIKNDGVSIFIVRTIKYSIVKLKRLTRKKNEVDIAKWKSLKNKYAGKRIFIIGNGPSLNKTPLYFLKEEYTMTFNRFNLMFERLNWKPTFYVVTDDLVVKDMYNEINNEVLPNVQYAFFPDLHPSNVNFKKYVENRENVYWLNTDSSEYRTDLPNCGINKTVVNAGMQIAAYMGFTEIYLIGVDMTFENQKVKKLNSRNWEAGEKDPNHFDPRYFDKGRKYHNPTTHEMIEKFETGKIFFENLGVKIYNAGVNGKLEVFQRKPLVSLFNFDDLSIKLLVNEIVFLKDNDILFSTVIENATTEISESDCSQSDFFKTSINDAPKFISKLINSHIAIGPYYEEYFFIKKNNTR